jgi:hypothetical protein
LIKFLIWIDFPHLVVEEKKKKMMTISWLEGNQMAEKKEFEAKQKELEAVVNPILQNLSGGAGGMPGGMSGGMPGGMPDFGGAGGAGPGPSEGADGLRSTRLIKYSSVYLFDYIIFCIFVDI